MTVGDRALGSPRTRADRVRARRARELRKLEPLAGELAGSKPRRRRPRRRYDLPLPVEVGAEISLPALPNLRVGPRLVSFLLLVLLGLGARGLMNSASFYVSEAAVTGAEMLTDGQVRSIGRADRIPVFLVDPRAVEAAFDDIAEVAEVEVRVRWPNRVEIEIQERTPMVAWNDGGRRWWLSDEGVAFLDHGEWPGLIRVTSEEPVLNIQKDPLAEVIDPQILVAAGVLSAQLPEAEAFRFHPIHGLGFDDPRGWTAYFGMQGDFVMKVRLYRAVAEKLEKDGVAASLISVKDASSPYYRQ